MGEKGKKGRLVRVELEPGRFVKMHREDAIAQRLLKPKAKRPAEDKRRQVEEDKGTRGQGKEVSTRVLTEAGKALNDDFTEIRGIGKATAAMLYARGVWTFEGLRTVDLEGLPEYVRRVVEEWRNE